MEEGSFSASPSAHPAIAAATYTPAPSASWEPTATAACEAVKAALDQRLKRVGEDLYADLLYAVQDYLLENVLGNLRSMIDGAERQANIDRQRAITAENNVRHLSAAVRMCVRRIEQPETSPDASVVVERALALLAAHGEHQ